VFLDAFEYQLALVHLRSSSRFVRFDRFVHTAVSSESPSEPKETGDLKDQGWRAPLPSGVNLVPTSLPFILMCWKSVNSKLVKRALARIVH
jgi:hypothetical protein